MRSKEKQPWKSQENCFNAGKVSFSEIYTARSQSNHMDKKLAYQSRVQIFLLPWTCLAIAAPAICIRGITTLISLMAQLSAAYQYNVYHALWILTSAIITHWRVPWAKLRTTFLNPGIVWVDKETEVTSSLAAGFSTRANVCPFLQLNN